MGPIGTTARPGVEEAIRKALDACKVAGEVARAGNRVTVTRKG